jgi:uncharacterized protein YjiS (DUF1127 family)
MTTANFARSRPGVLAGGERVAHGFIARLRGSLGEYVAYSRTLAELRALNARELADIGFASDDIKAVARAAARRN